MIDIDADAGLPDTAQQHRTDNGTDQQDIDLAFDAELHAFLALIRRWHRMRFALHHDHVEDEEDDQQQTGYQQHRQEQMGSRPEEMYALQKAEEQRWITERGQGTADIRDQEDKENKDMRLALAPFIGPDHRPDQQHCRTGRSHPAGDHRADQQHGGIDQRCAPKRTNHPHSTRDGIERAEQDDERHIFEQERVQQLKGRERKPEQNGKWHEKTQRPESRHLAEMMMPEIACNQREDGNRQQNPDKGNGPEQAQIGTIEMWCATMPGDSFRRMSCGLVYSLTRPCKVHRQHRQQ